ncbi:hypothetical protein [Vreelandella venusta]|uniref:hypothetical protein n=1 Tax=Vreelandella venusta TaxID=44935 RepID=UPI0018DA7542|nr:hypothetical protein [Halomonas venusta]QPI65921.1 hypothetical protein IR195_09590 [Halomonas venusta]
MLNPDKGLFRHGWFWAMVLGPVLIAVGLAWFYGLFDLPLSKTLDGIDTFYERGKFFLAIAALSIPLGATFSRMLATEQTAELIRTSESRREEDNQNKLLENYLNLLEGYNDRLFGYNGDWPFYSETIAQPIKSFHYHLSFQRKMFHENYNAPTNICIDFAYESLMSEFIKNKSGDVLRQRQSAAMNLFKWAKNEINNLTIGVSDEVVCDAANDFLGFYFTNEKYQGESAEPSQDFQTAAIRSLVRYLCIISEHYYYSSQIFYLYDFKFAKYLEDLANKITFLSMCYRRYLNASNEIEYDSIDDGHFLEIFGDVKIENQEVRKIAIAWYLLKTPVM